MVVWWWYFIMYADEPAENLELLGYQVCACVWNYIAGRPYSEKIILQVLSVICTEAFHLFYYQDLAVLIFYTKIVLITNWDSVSSDSFHGLPGISHVRVLSFACVAWKLGHSVKFLIVLIWYYYYSSFHCNLSMTAILSLVVFFFLDLWLLLILHDWSWKSLPILCQNLLWLLLSLPCSGMFHELFCTFLSIPLVTYLLALLQNLSKWSAHPHLMQFLQYSGHLWVPLCCYCHFHVFLTSLLLFLLNCIFISSFGYS